MDSNLKVQGFFLIDVDVVALNNAGKNMILGVDNAVATKSIIKNGRRYAYVSGQAFRFWWRNALQKNCGWILSPVIRAEKVAFTNTNPIEYPDDDIFGYMRAASEETEGEKGKKKKTNVTVTRASPLKNSAVVSACAVSLAEYLSSMTRQEGDAVLFVKQEYSAIMKGMFSLDLNMVGTFSNYNKSGYNNLSEKLKLEALEKGAALIDDLYIPNQKLIQLPVETRIQRAVDTIKALKYISGGAMQTNNMGDVTPKLIVLATTNTGNHPFSYIATSRGERDEMLVLNIQGLKEVLEDYKESYVGKIFIGKRTGFLDDETETLKELQKEYSGLIEFGSVNAMIDAYCEQLKQQMD